MTINPVPARWRVRFPSLGARLVGLFIVLAVAVAITFMLGMHVLQQLHARHEGSADRHRQHEEQPDQPGAQRREAGAPARGWRRGDRRCRAHACPPANA